MRKNNYGYYGYIMVLFIILLVGTYKIINNSYGYFSNIRDVEVLLLMLVVFIMIGEVIYSLIILIWIRIRQ